MKKQLIFLFLLGTFLVNTDGFSQCSVLISSTPNNPVCKNTTVNFTASSGSGNITSYVWMLNGDTVSNGTSYSTNTNGAFIELYATLDNCSGATDTVVYSQKYILNSEFHADYNIIVVECNQPVADIEITGITEGPTPGTAPYTYDLILDEGNQGQQDIYTDVPIGTYPLVVTDANGCIDTTWIDMSVVQCPPPSPTEVITPNEDGYNDTWRINNIEFYPDNEVFIFDRWGQRVYHKKEYDNKDGWDVKYIGTNLPVSTYYYVLKITFEKSEEQVFKGPISVFR